MISLALSAALPLLVFTAVPFAAYLATRRRARGFRAYVGLYRPERRTLWYAAAVAAVFTGVMLLIRAAHLDDLAAGPNTVPGRLRPLGSSATAFVALAPYAVVQTSLSEELLLRGFLAKRLAGALGFRTGNLLQAALFGALHLLLFAGPAGAAFTWARAAFIVASTGAAGWLLGAVNERRGNGSILPSWLAHAATNLTAYGVLAFGGP